MATKADGTLASTQEFGPWGTIRSGGIAQTTRNYTGQRRDDTGLLFYNARYYDPALRRFISADTVVPGVGALTATAGDATERALWGKSGGGTGTPQALNRYSYGLNNPVKYTDPTGHCVDGATTALCVVGGVAAAATAPAWVVPVAIGVGVIALGAGIAYIASEVIHQADDGQATTTGTDAGVQPKGGTYVLKDPETGAIERTGRTKDVERRRQEHARDPEFGDLDYDVDAKTDDYAQQRGREQILHEKYNPPKNKIRPIRPDHPKLKDYLDEGGKVQGNY